MKVLVTGGAGFCGRRFVRHLLSLAHEVTVIDNLYSGKTPDFWMYQVGDLGRHPNAKWMYADVRSVFPAMKPHDYDIIIHLAAIVGGRLNIENDPLAVATDLSIDAELFNWVVRSPKPPQVIYFSSSAVYPNYFQTRGSHQPLREDMQLFGADEIGMPDMTYGWSKLSGEYLAKFAAEKYGLDVKIYRPFGGYGEDQDFNYPFPSIIKRIMDNNDPVIVWGSGEQQRDFIHIEDVVDAVLATRPNMASGQV